METVDGYDAFLETWQTIIDDAENEGLPDSSCFSDFEAYATTAFHMFLETEETEENSKSWNALGRHDCAAITMTAQGRIVQTNLQAFSELGLSVGKTLADFGIIISQDVIAARLNDKAGPPSNSFHVLQVDHVESESSVTLAVSAVQNNTQNEPLLLVLIFQPPNAQAAAEILSRKFDYTASETVITKMFLDGNPLREIATRRGRSYTTIRNQFQSVLDKSGVTSQTALFRLSFSLLRLVEQTEIDAPAHRSALTRTMSLPRPHGRVLEVVLSGDQSGRPLLNMPSLFGHGLTRDVEEILKSRGILLISIMRPGFGGTLPPPKSDPLFDCTASDVRAVLDSLEIGSCPCFARASAARSFYNVLTRLPDRITKGVIVNGMVRRNFIAGKTVTSKWTTALMSASILSYPIAKLILGTGHSLLGRSKGASFLKKMYQGSASDCAALDDPDVVHSIKSGVQDITKQGTSAGVQEIVDTFRNWSIDLRDLQTPVTVYHGADDPNVPLAAVRDFVADHSDHLTLIVEPKGGGQLSYSHFEEILDLVFPPDAKT